MATAVLSSFHSTENAPHPIHVEDLTLKQKQEAQRERRLKDAVRRYYALVELVETERGYLTDLRILVQVSLFGLSRFFFLFFRVRLFFFFVSLLSNVLFTLHPSASIISMNCFRVHLCSRPQVGLFVPYMLLYKFISVL